MSESVDVESVDDRIPEPHRWKPVGMWQFGVGDRDPRPPTARMRGVEPPVKFARRAAVPAPSVNDPGPRLGRVSFESVAAAEPRESLGAPFEPDTRTPGERVVPKGVFASFVRRVDRLLTCGPWESGVPIGRDANVVEEDFHRRVRLGIGED